MLESKGDKKAAQHWLDRAVEDTQRALALDDQSSDAHTLLADIYGSKIGLEGFMAAVRFGSKAESESKVALRLNPENPRVHLTLGRRYLYSPKLFGGDLDQAIASFKKATTLDPHSDEAFRWLAIASLQKKDLAQAKAALDEALRLNPRNRSTQRLLQVSQ
jgi:tetratricopeptide (TPR) repeat protein